MGAGAGFGVALDAEDGFANDGDALDGAIEQRAVGDFDVIGQLIIADGEAVVLAGDFDFACL